VAIEDRSFDKELSHGALPVKGRAAEITLYELFGIVGRNDSALSAGGVTA
jgi:hypothetical protein